MIRKKTIQMFVCLTLAACFTACDDSGDSKPAAKDSSTSGTATTATPAASTTSSSSSTTAKADTYTPPPKTASKSINPSFDAADDVADPSTVNLTGTWGWKYSGKYVLRQSGTSLQGSYSDPQDPEIHGAIAGYVQGARLEIDVIVTHDVHREKDFTAHKSGQIHSNDHMTLVVTGGPNYLGDVQEWYRQ